MMQMEEWSAPDQIIACDACLEGCGGISESGEFFHSIFPKLVTSQELHINALELLTIVVALKLWAHKLRGKRLLMLCDNITSVFVINKGRTRDLFLQKCLREICFLAASAEVEVRAKHISGENNRLPDLLSRWSIDTKNQELFWVAVKDRDVQEVCVDESLFDFTHSW